MHAQLKKHFKLDNKDCGPDASFSLLPSDLKELVDVTNEAWKALMIADSLQLSDPAFIDNL